MRQNKIFAIGDIHGCYDELRLLIKQLPITDEDTVVFLGDYIDRGAQSRQVIEQLIRWSKNKPNWHFLKGNHEDMCIDYYSGTKRYDEGIWHYNGGDKVIDSYGGGDMPYKHIIFLASLKDYYETEDYFFVHAGISPELTIEENKLTINEVKFKHPYHLWVREGFLDRTGHWDKKVIFGHTPNSREKIGQPIIHKDKIGIDGAVCPNANKNLIAVELPSEKFYFQKSLYLERRLIKEYGLS